MSGAQEPHVSVITPVYNGEKHLPECIDSVLAQNYSNFDYIILITHNSQPCSEGVMAWEVFS